MSFATLVELASAPEIPPAGKTRIFINSGGTVSSIDDAGVVTTYGTGITPEEVQDIVGALLQDSTNIDVTYNDAGNAITFDLTNTGVTAATYGSTSQAPQITVDAKGRITSASNASITPASIGAQPLDADLTAVAGLTGSGLVTRTGAGTATTRTLTAGTGVTVTNGDGVSGNPTVALTNVGTAGTFGSATTIPSITTNAQGQITGVTNNLVAIPPTQVTGFDEAAQDAVGGILTDSSSIDFTYSDGGNSIQAAVIPGGVDHNGLLNLTTGNPHTQYLQTSVAATTYQPLDSDLTAVAGLAGTGFISRTGTGTAITRTITAGTGITVTDGDGISGNPTIATTITQYTDELAQDAVGAALTDTASVDLTYNDVANQITAAVIPGGVDHNSLANLTTGNPHTQYLQTSVAASTYQPLDPDLSAIAALGANGILVRTGAGGAAVRTIAGGTGITVTNNDAVAGSPTVAITNTGVTAATYGSATQVPQVALNAQGQATSASNVSIQIAQSQVTNLTTDLAGKANLAGGNTFTGSQTINGNTVTVFDTTGTSVNINSNGSLGNTSNLNFTPFVGRTGGPSSIVRAIDNGASTSDLIFLNAPAGSSSVATELFRITSDGRFTFTSTTGPVSIPRMTTAQREAITSPLVGSQVYDTTIGTICRWSGSAWLFEIDLTCVNNQTSTSVTYANITELTSPVLPAARYQFEFTGVGQSTVTTTGIGIRLGAGTATVSSVVANWGFSLAANGTDKNFEYSQLGPTTDIASTGVLTANADFPMYGTGVFTTSTPGTVAAQIRSEIAASGVSIRINSHLRIRKITG